MGIRIENLSKRYEGRYVIQDLTWEIPTGSFTTILAPTGSGKTTLLRMLSGVEKPSSGKVHYNDVDVTRVPVQQRNVAMVYQQFINYPSLTVYENIASPLRVSRQRYTREEIDRQVRHFAELLRISHVLDHLPEQVSGGEKQRTAIARALIKGARFIFLDEPLGNLDYKLREELRGELKTVFKGCTIVYATPEPIDALSMSTHVGFLHSGRIIQFGRVEEVYSKPGFIEVGYYFNDPPMNMLDCRLVSENGDLILKASEDLKFEVNRFRQALRGKEFVLGIRPQHVSAAEPRGRGFLPVDTVIDFTEIVGSATTLHLLHGELRLGSVVDKPVKRHRTGQSLTVYLNPQHMFVYEKETRKLVIADGEALASRENGNHTS